MRKRNDGTLFWFILFAVYCWVPLQSVAQPLLQPFGTQFVFSIPEDASHIGSATAPGKIFLYILSAYEGKGELRAPKQEYAKTFTFKPNTLTALELPRSLMHARASGKFPLGLQLKTSVPVNVTLHNILPFAGESTQIHPVENLGKEYVVASWGLYNDPREDNHAQITITPTLDNTEVTITPSVATLVGSKKHTPITITLQQGESYTLKADTSSGRSAGLSGTMIRSSQPVSVMTSVTCAYVPIGSQACNTLIDHLLPLTYAGTEFFVSPLGDTLREAFVVFTSPVQDFSITLSDGKTVYSTAGRALIEINRPLRCISSAPVLCHLLTPGVQTALISDPSMVTILPTTHYQDTLLWQTPNLAIDGIPFFHTVNIIHEDAAQIRLDDKPLEQQGVRAQIFGTDRFVTQVVVQPGLHFLTATSPVFAVAAGFYSADAYAFLPMGGAVVHDEPEPEEGLILSTRMEQDRLHLHIAGSADEVIEVIIFEALGNIALTRKGAKAELKTLEIGLLPAGTYVLEITSNGRRGKTRFTITR